MRIFIDNGKRKTFVSIPYTIVGRIEQLSVSKCGNISERSVAALDPTFDCLCVCAIRYNNNNNSSFINLAI